MPLLRISVFLSLFVMSGCVSTSNVPASGIAFKLDGCTPFLNCVSSESGVGIYQVEPIKLNRPVDPAVWDRIKDIALDLPGASLESARYGYANITFYSETFSFPDYFEILLAADRKSLAVRSQSLIGLYDLGVNRDRVEMLRQRLVEQKIAVGADDR